MSTHKGQNCEIKRLGEPKGHLGGQPKSFFCLYKYRRIRGNKGLFPSETCEKLVVRGTISFGNNIITISPVGESFGVECSNAVK